MLATGRYFSNINKVNLKIIVLLLNFFQQFLVSLSKEEMKKIRICKGEKVLFELLCIIIDDLV